MEKNYILKKKRDFKLKQKIITSILFLMMVLGTNSLKAQVCSLNALNDQTVCENQTVTLGNASSINELTTTSILWTQIAGPSVVIDTPLNEITTIQGIVGGNTYTFRLSGVCIVDGLSEFDDIIITVNPITQAIAGSNIEGCPGNYSLNANPPGTNETGEWSVVSGSGVSLSDINTPGSETSGITFQQNSSGTAVLQWEITHSNGCSSTDTISINNYGGDPAVDAGADQLTNISECYTTTQSTSLSASNGGNGTEQLGTWSFVSGPSVPTFGNINSSSSNLSNLIEGTYVLRWSVAGPCVTGDDTVTVVVPAATQNVTNAGGINLDQRFCLGAVTSTVLEGNTPLYAGETVQWIQTGGPLVAEAVALNIPFSTTPTTTITGLDGASSYTFSYTITAPPLGGAEICDDSAVFRVRYYNDPVTIELDGGNNNVILGVGVSSGSVPITYTGGSNFTYTVLSEPSGSSSSFGFSSGNLNFSGLNKIGTYVVRVTRQTDGQIGTACGSASDDISIIVSSDTNGTLMAANAGTDPNMTCGQTSANLNGNDPLLPPPGDTNVYTGYWTQLSGPNAATFDDTSLYNVNVSGLVPGIYEFRWHISGGVGAPESSDEAQIIVAASFNSQILLPINNSTVCAGDLLLEAGPLGSGETGAWTQTDAYAPVSIANSTNPVTYISGLLPGITNYEFTWSVSNSLLSGCDYISTVQFNTSTDVAPAPAYAGTNQCLAGGVTSVTMAADNSSPLFSLPIVDPDRSVGTWTMLSGPSTPPELPSTIANETFTGLVPGLYTFNWETSNTNPCTTTFSNVVTVFVSDNTTYTVTPIADVCTTSTAGVVTMNALDPSSEGLTGTWIQLEGDNTWTITTGDINDPNAEFSGLVPGFINLNGLLIKVVVPLHLVL
jgi:hypothetical protein